MLDIAQAQGGAGSGGSIVVIANQLLGLGSISASGGAGSYVFCCSCPRLSHIFFILIIAAA